MYSKHRTSVWLLVLILALPGMAAAIKKGRLVGKVVDPDGQPIEGVTVTATSPDVPGFQEVEVTDNKGVFKVDFDEIDVVYAYRFDKVGYQILKVEQTWKKDGTERHTFVMQPGESAAVGDLPVASMSAPAVEAYNAGAAALKGGDAATAIARFEEALGHDPELRQAWAALSAARLEAKRYEEAAAAAEKAIALGATDLLVLRTRWEAYRNLGDEARTAEAQAAVEKAGIAAEEAKRVFNEAVGFVKADDHEAAFARFEEASELDPNLAEAVLGVATTALATGRYEEAIAAAKTLLESDPRHEQAIRVRYNASLELKDNDKIFDALMGLAPYEPEVARTGLWNLALTAYDDNDTARAKVRFGRYLEIDPGRAEGHYYLGLANVSEGAYDEAKRHFERFLELAPNAKEAGEVRDFLEGLGSS